MKIIQTISIIISKYLPVWIVLLSIISYIIPYIIPDAFISIRQLTGFGLGTIFFLMGLSLSSAKLLEVIKHPKYALLGVVLKWTIMVGVSISSAYVFFADQEEIATGVILAGTVPSGTSANIYTFIAGGEVALSITMATLDTFISPILTPVLLQTFTGRFLPIAFWPLFMNIIAIVFLPLLLGLFVQWKFKRSVAKVKPYTSVLSQLALFLVILSVISNAQQVLSENLSVLPLVFPSGYATSVSTDGCGLCHGASSRCTGERGTRNFISYRHL